MRESCYDCTRKHLAQALILMIEAKMGYPLHRYIAIGHMAEAEAEFLAEDEEVANYIRAKRKLYEMGEDVDILELIEVVCNLENQVEPAPEVD